MAEKSTSKPKKRRVKNPETFRERALKAKEQDKRSRPSVFGAIGRVFSPIAASLKKVFDNPAGKAILKPVKLILKLIFPKYFRNSYQELKLVTWPSFKQSRQLTFAVLVFAVIFGASIAVLDYGLEHLFRNILLK
jgi:preprotein translocase subunit SecE